MSHNPGSPSPIQPLSLGNVVSAGLKLYSSHLKSYLKLASVAYLWIFVPVYGWAKCSATLALISRLAFGELVSQPESVESGRRFVNTRLWQFLVMGLLMLAISMGFTIVIMIPFGILAVILAGIFVASQTSGATVNPIIVLTLVLLILLLIPIFIVALLWVQARFCLVEIPLAVEDNVDGTSTIGRSWELTKGHVWRIAAILFVAYLITFPIQLPFTFVSTILQGIVETVAQDRPGYAILLSLARLVIILIGGALVVPFWQSIKAVIYYDLRSRREGLGLRIRDNSDK
ncbi:DUF975 family protein [Scytonema sp. UIC 10036]|uniref:glycerophosphoryl diester phosphodiesterase membrane domain-containing protein n=1 Tax=Scytonema sp. UIC 10036 TaxID=2304196 RepID=UPI0012DA9E0C|nr:glycerophosphoryl diester phosphodiesterase membrane domain-containing protein [Scytonema sp. UIC 10036]MUG95232.1 DUF975 family protein [Scytonema sp. UIC 10036]